MALVSLTTRRKRASYTNCFSFPNLKLTLLRAIDQDKKTASKNDLEFWGHSWRRHPITGTAPGQVVKEATCLWAPPFLNPHPVLSTSPPRHLAASLDSQSHLYQHETHTLSHAKARLTKSGLNPGSVYVLKVFREWAEKRQRNQPKFLSGVSQQPSQNVPGDLSEGPDTSTPTVLLGCRDPILFNIGAQWRPTPWRFEGSKPICVE